MRRRGAAGKLESARASGSGVINLETAMEVTADYADYAEEEGLGFVQRILL